MARTTKKLTGRSEEYIINQKYLGKDEPTFTEPLTMLEYSKALNWYNYMNNTSDARGYIMTYLLNTGRKADAQKLKSVSDTWIPTTVAWVCRLVTRGFDLPVDVVPFIDDRIAQTLSKAVERVVDTDAPKISIQDRMKERASEILGEVEGLVDDHADDESFSFYQWLQANNIPASYVSSIVDKLNPVLLELLEAYKGDDPQLKEGYSYLSKPQLKKRIYFFNTMIEDADRYASNTKKATAQRKPRTVSVEKKIKNLKWQKEDATYKIASVAPEKIIGAQELWTFNTKYKTLTVFRALDRAGLQVKGTSITNYDEKTSSTSSTGRRPEEYVKRTLEGGKIVLRKLMDELKTKKPLAYRINENTILLRVVQ
jgi:hypothetical protein